MEFGGIHWATIFQEVHQILISVMSFKITLLKPHLPVKFVKENVQMWFHYFDHMGQVTELWLSCYLVLLSTDSKKAGNKTAAVSWPDPYDDLPSSALKS